MTGQIKACAKEGMTLYEIFMQCWAGYWHAKYFYTSNRLYWILGLLPTIDGWDSTGKITNNEDRPKKKA